MNYFEIKCAKWKSAEHLDPHAIDRLKCNTVLREVSIKLKTLTLVLFFNLELLPHLQNQIPFKKLHI